MGFMEAFYPESKFGGFTNVDGSIVFFARVSSLLAPSFTVLDVGCGRGAYGEDAVAIRRNLRIIKGKVSKVIGIDVDKDAGRNPFLDEFRCIDGSSWPIEKDSIDLIVCDNVLEHVENPEQFFSEARRVLKNGGYLCIRTPNKWNYIAMFSQLIPNKYHSRVTDFVQDNRKEDDVFPVVYKCNSIRKIRKMMTGHDFECAVCGYEAEPYYLSFSKIAYWLGVLHQRFAPGFLRPAIFAFGRIKKK